MSGEDIGYSSRAWLGDKGKVLQSGTATMALQSTSSKKWLPALITPMWSLHCDLHGDVADKQSLLRNISQLTEPIKVLDLMKEALPEGHDDWVVATRHTRQVRLTRPWDDLKWPAHRLKQQRRFHRENGRIQIDADRGWDDVLKLHLESRQRKSLDGQSNDLQALLTRISEESWTYCVTAHDESGAALASGGFVILKNGTAVYAFGGQHRSKQSGIASVAMLLAAAEEACRRGCTSFDFGGSLDAGVDKFYAEFGADPVPIVRHIQAPWWFRWVFPKTWKAWTKQSPITS